MLPRSPSPLSDLTGTQVAARFTYAGVSPATTRAGLEVQPASLAARRAANRAGATWLRTHTPRAATTRAARLTAWREATATTDTVAPALLGAIGAALTDVVIRDAVLTSLIPDVDPDLPAQVLTGQGNTPTSPARSARSWTPPPVCAPARRPRPPSTCSRTSPPTPRPPAPPPQPRCWPCSRGGPATEHAPGS